MKRKCGFYKKYKIMKRKCGFYKKYKIIKGGVLGNLGSPDWFPSQKMI